MESIEKTGAPAEALAVYTSPKWNLKTPEGRTGFFVELKELCSIKPVPLAPAVADPGVKRKLDDIS